MLEHSNVRCSMQGSTLAHKLGGANHTAATERYLAQLHGEASRLLTLPDEAGSAPGVERILQLDRRLEFLLSKGGTEHRFPVTVLGSLSDRLSTHDWIRLINEHLSPHDRLGYQDYVVVDSYDALRDAVRFLFGGFEGLHEVAYYICLHMLVEALRLDYQRRQQQSLAASRNAAEIKVLVKRRLQLSKSSHPPVPAIGSAGCLQRLKSLQHQGGTKFCIAVTSSAAAAKLATRGSFVLNGVAVPVGPVGPQVIAVTVFRCPLYLGDASLAAAFSQYGKVLDIFEQTFKGRQHVGNSLRVVRLEMSKPVPNFMTVQGHRVMCDYRGVTKVCSRCSQEGHVGKDCHTPRCARCEAFGHDTTGCSAPCRRCAGEHATADCLQPRSYAAAASAKPAPGRTIPVAADDETRAQTAGIQVEAEVAQAGRPDNLREEATDKDWSSWAEDSSFGPLAEKDTSPSADAESQSGASQATSTASDYSGAPASHIEKEPQSPSTSSAESTPGKNPGAKPIGSQVAAGRGHRKHTVDPPNRRAAAETSSPPHDQSPSSPISRIVKQARDPSLRNPLHLLTDSLGQDDEMETGKPDLKRPHHSSSSSADELANPRKQQATEQSRPADPTGSAAPDSVTDVVGPVVRRREGVFWSLRISRRAESLQNPPSESELAATRHFLDARVVYDGSLNALLLPAAVLLRPVLYPEDVPVEMVMSTLGPLLAEELYRALLPPPDDTDLWTSETRHAIDRFERCLRSLWLRKTNETLTTSPLVADGSRGVGPPGAYGAGELLFWVQGARVAFAGLQEALSGFQRATNWPSYWRRAQKSFFRRFCLLRCSASKPSSRIRCLLPLANMIEFAQAFECPTVAPKGDVGGSYCSLQ
ncbi:hypothetical protein HPB52_019266 [Rhipicephalus sanguineus]|uniref:CCHC-type domain-containing protein n=1 Tax=Rhipicephalus sanguineus TaxID=34632 RepID=A0A9D4QA72_RHISA|nr:hypothetical protein HPB52_019266 [Rhipicephalus sanguineus]